MSQTHLLKVRPNSLEDPVKWNKAGPNIRKVKGILTDHSLKVGNKLHGAKSYQRKRTQIIHGVPTTDTLNHEKPSRHIRMAEIFTSALMRGSPPNLFRIECIWDNLNSGNTSKSHVSGQGRGGKISLRIRLETRQLEG